MEDNVVTDTGETRLRNSSTKFVEQEGLHGVVRGEPHSNVQQAPWAVTPPEPDLDWMSYLSSLVSPLSENMNSLHSRIVNMCD